MATKSTARREVHDLIVYFAETEGWGAGRIKGELYKLGYRRIGRSTINRILRANGFPPAPPARKGTWLDFLNRHRETIIADVSVKMSRYIDWIIDGCSS